MLCKASFWLDLITDSGRPTGLAERGLRALPAVAAGLGTAAIWHWNVALLLVLPIGAGSGFALFQILQRKQHWLIGQGWQQRSSSQVTLALSIGGGSVLGLMAHALLTVENANTLGLIFLMLIQDAIICCVLVLVVRSFTQKASAPGYTFNRCVAGLLHRDELQQLVAVRQFETLVREQQLSPREQTIAAEYLLLLSRKQNDPIMSGAIQETLNVLAPSRPQLGASGWADLESESILPLVQQRGEIGSDRREELELDFETAFRSA